MGNYESRKVANYQDKKTGLTVDTCKVYDSTQPYETGIQHPSYNNGRWVIVEQYQNKKSAGDGHKRWVGIMTSESLPKSLTDVSTATVARLLDQVSDDRTWRDKKIGRAKK